MQCSRDLFKCYKIWKKKLIWHSSLGDLEIEEQLYRCCEKNTLIRSFSYLTKTKEKTKAYSIRLQRIITDFGCDFSFLTSQNKIKFHHGINLPNSAARRITLKNAQDAKKYEQENNMPIISNSQIIISETDGSMIHVVEYKEPNITTILPSNRFNIF